MRMTLRDDEPNELAHIKELAAEYIRGRGLDMDLKCFSSARALLDHEPLHGAGRCICWTCSCRRWAALFRDLDECFSYLLPPRRQAP